MTVTCAKGVTRVSQAAQVALIIHWPVGASNARMDGAKGAIPLSIAFRARSGTESARRAT